MRDSTFSRMCWMAARGANVLGEDLVRLSANDFRSACDKSRNTSDAIAARLLPIHIDGIFESAVLEYRPRFLHGQPHRLRDLQKHFLVGEVTAFDKISFVESVVNLLEPRLGIGPFRELLRQPAVIRVRAPVIRKMFGVHQPFHRSEEHTSELQSQSHISYAVFCLKK